jgi:hypothetical protein
MVAGSWTRDGWGGPFYNQCSLRRQCIHEIFSCQGLCLVQHGHSLFVPASVFVGDHTEMAQPQQTMDTASFRQAYYE